MANNNPESLPTTVYEAIEGMAARYNPEEANDLIASIQFNITSAETQDEYDHYHLVIENSKCIFNVGRILNPTLIINSPADVWLKISRKEMNSTMAFLTRKYNVEGNFGLLTRMDKLFLS